jgi:hypothetical protein
MKKIACFVLAAMLWASCAKKEATVQPEATANAQRNAFATSAITKVQPMTGIVFWDTSPHNTSDAISLEYSYMLYNDIVKQKGVYDWSKLEQKLNNIAARGHQAILRFRFTYPGYQTSVPDYIKAMSSYNETTAWVWGEKTYYPDWSNAELKNFLLEFYEKYAARYDQDKRLAFVQLGFGHYAEYHTYPTAVNLGKNFPSKSFQTRFFEHLDRVFDQTPWSISIDAASSSYSPISDNPFLLNIGFGVFDDSFMHQDHSGYNEDSWNFFNRQRYATAPAGGEFSYYTDYDQQNVLNPTGAHGESYESFAARFHITYMIGNDQPDYQSTARIKAASMASGYKFEVTSLSTEACVTTIKARNNGIAPLYYDAYFAIGGNRASGSLKGLLPGEEKTFTITHHSDDNTLTIECDRLLPGQEIQYQKDF